MTKATDPTDRGLGRRTVCDRRVERAAERPSVGALAALFNPLPTMQRFLICLPQIAFMQDLTYKDLRQWMPLFVFERFIDIYFMIDIVINFRSAWLNDEGHVLYNWRKQVCFPENDLHAET